MPQILNKMDIGDTVTFDVYPAPILGTQFKNCTNLAILDYDTVKLMNIDPDAMHAKVVGYLPAAQKQGSWAKASGYPWIRIRLANGTITAIGQTWINADTIVINDSLTITLVLTDANQTDIDKLSVMMSANGYDATKYSITSS